MNESRADRYRREHAKAVAKMRAIADRPLPPRRTRLLLVGGYLLLVAFTAAAPFALPEAWSNIAQLAAVIAGGVLWFAVRRATRLITEAPDEVLDELLVRLRNATYLDAYRILGAIAVLGGAALTVVGGHSGIGPEAAAAAGWPLIMLAFALPALAAATTLPDVDDEP